MDVIQHDDGVGFKQGIRIHLPQQHAASQELDLGVLIGSRVESDAICYLSCVATKFLADSLADGGAGNPPRETDCNLLVNSIACLYQELWYFFG